MSAYAAILGLIPLIIGAIFVVLVGLLILWIRQK